MGRKPSILLALAVSQNLPHQIFRADIQAVDVQAVDIQAAERVNSGAMRRINEPWPADACPDSLAAKWK
jgi:hypothetical protein